jgi:RNA polymerase sigma-70 factor (ECF subfamily)
VRATAGSPQPDVSEPRVRELLERYLRAWQLADIDGLVRLISEDVRLSMPPLTAWFHGRQAVAAFIEDAIFAPARPHGIRLRAGRCNGQPAFATYEPDGSGRLVASGLQVLQLADVDGQPLITALVSYRDPALAIRCGLPAVLDEA